MCKHHGIEVLVGTPTVSFASEIATILRTRSNENAMTDCGAIGECRFPAAHSRWLLTHPFNISDVHWSSCWGDGQSFRRNSNAETHLIRTYALTNCFKSQHQTCHDETPSTKYSHLCIVMELSRRKHCIRGKTRVRWAWEDLKNPSDAGDARLLSAFGGWDCRWFDFPL